MNPKITLILGIAAALLIAGCTQTGLSHPNSQTSSDTGRTVFTITDAAADMGTVSSVNVTVDEVRAHSKTDGWRTVSSDQQTYDLLKLKASGTQKVLADADLPNGTYNQLRLDVSNAVVVDENGTHQAKLPSNTLKMQGAFTADANETAAATFDFIADESLHVTGNGTYLFAPVVQVETRENASVDINSDNTVNVRGGNIRTNARVGMNANGTMGVGLGIPDNAAVTVTGGTISVGGGSQQNHSNGTQASGSAEVRAGNSSASASGSIGIN